MQLSLGQRLSNPVASRRLWDKVVTCPSQSWQGTQVTQEPKSLAARQYLPWLTATHQTFHVWRHLAQSKR